MIKAAYGNLNIARTILIRVWFFACCPVNVHKSIFKISARVSLFQSVMCRCAPVAPRDPDRR